MSCRMKVAISVQSGPLVHALKSSHSGPSGPVVGLRRNLTKKKRYHPRRRGAKRCPLGDLKDELPNLKRLHGPIYAKNFCLNTILFGTSGPRGLPSLKRGRLQGIYCTFIIHMIKYRIHIFSCFDVAPPAALAFISNKAAYLRGAQIMESLGFDEGRPSELQPSPHELVSHSVDELPLTSRTFPEWQRGKVFSRTLANCYRSASCFLAVTFT